MKQYLAICKTRRIKRSILFAGTMDLICIPAGPVLTAKGYLDIVFITLKGLKMLSANKIVKCL